MSPRPIAEFVCRTNCRILFCDGVSTTKVNDTWHPISLQYSKKGLNLSHSSFHHGRNGTGRNYLQGPLQQSYSKLSMKMKFLIALRFCHEFATSVTMAFVMWLRTPHAPKKSLAYLPFYVSYRTYFFNLFCPMETNSSLPFRQHPHPFTRDQFPEFFRWVLSRSPFSPFHLYILHPSPPPPVINHFMRWESSCQHRPFTAHVGKGSITEYFKVFAISLSTRFTGDVGEPFIPQCTFIHNCLGEFVCLDALDQTAELKLAGPYLLRKWMPKGYWLILRVAL